MWEHILQCRPERLPVRLSLAPRAAQWYPNATVRGFADIRPTELAKRIKDLKMRPDEQGYRFILNELMDREVSHSLSLSLFLLSYQLNFGISPGSATLLFQVANG